MRIMGCWLLLLTVLLVALPPAVHAAGATPTMLRVSTPVYTLDEQGLHVPGYAIHDTPGAPALPVWATMVELPPEGRWSLAYKSHGQQELVAPGLILPVPSPQVILDAPLTPQEIAERMAAAPLMAQPDPGIYGADAFYPSSPVQAGPEQWQRGRRLLMVQVFPFQYNPVTGKLLYHPDIEVRVTAEAVTTQENASAPGDGGFSRPATAEAVTAQEDALAPGSGGFSRPALRIYTGERGIYRLTYADLQAAGVPVGSVDPVTFAMTYLDQPVDILVTGEADGRFDPGDLIIFYAEPYQGRYMTHNVYRLSYGGAPGSRMQTRRLTPTGGEPVITAITQTVHIEFDRSYYSTYRLPRDADHWFDNPLYPNAAMPSATVSYDLSLDDPLFVGVAEVRIALHGGADQAMTPDQSVAVYVDGRAVGTFQWDGSVPYLATATVPAAWLGAGPSAPRVTLEASLSQLPSLSYYWISPDWVEVRYPARPEAENDQIIVEGLVIAGQQAQLDVTGFTGHGVRTFDLRNPQRPVQLEGVFVEFNGSSFVARLWDAWSVGAPSPSYALSTDSGLLAPLSVERDNPSAWRSPDHAADYIAVVHSSLWDAVQPLLDHRAAEGLRVAKVDVQDIYDEFSAGRVDPDAIRSFLAYAYHHWNGEQAPPQYVLLVGDGHYDFKNAAGTNLPNLIPPYLLHIDPWIGETAADNRYVSVDGLDDYLPDMAIGRIPAQSPADVRAVVHKIIAYETATPVGAWQRRTVFVADDYANRDGNFHALSDVARLEVLPSSYASEAIYYRSSAELDTGPEMRAAILRAFNTGALYLQWFGHASQFRWGSVSFFDVLGPPALSPTGVLPFTAHYGCWSGYFINIRGSSQYANNPQSLGEVLLLTPERGAVADLSPSGLHIGNALLNLNRGVVEAIFRNRIDRIGPAVDAGRLYFVSHSSGWHDVVDTSILFGDPALRLRLPRPAAFYLPLVAVP